VNMDSVKNAMLAEIIEALSANNTDEKILNFADVAMGWHFGEGVQISSSAIRDAAKLHDTFLLNGFYETDAFPGLAGEVRVTAYHENQYFEFTREVNGKWSYVAELDGVIDDEQDSLTLEKAQGIVKNISERIWNTFDIFQDSTGTGEGSDFKVLHSGHRAMEAYRLWNTLVPYCTDRSANISESSIPMQENLQSFGSFRTQFSQTPLLSSSRQATQRTNATGILWASPANSQRTYFGQNVTNPMTLKSAQETNQDDSPLQISLPFDCFQRP
jgi:hypothetical protein